MIFLLSLCACLDQGQLTVTLLKAVNLKAADKSGKV